MKKFSINLLKVSLLFILSLCMYGIGNEVKARNVVYVTYYAEPGDEITTQFDWSNAFPTNKKYKKIFINNGSGFIDSGYCCENWSHDYDSENGYDGTITFKLPDNLPPEKSYFVYRDMDDFNEIYLLGKHTLTNSSGETNINLRKGDSTDLYMKYVYPSGTATSIKLAKTLNKVEDYTQATDRTPYYKESTVTFKSSDNNVATVNNDGKITAVGEGETIITMTRVIEQTRYERTSKNEFTATIDVTVTGGETTTLTMKFNGGVKNNAPGVTQDTQQKEKGGFITFQRNDLSKPNHTLVGWKLEGSENEIDFNHGANKTNNKITMDTNKTVIAVWEPIDDGNNNPNTGDINPDNAASGNNDEIVYLSMDFNGGQNDEGESNDKATYKKGWDVHFQREDITKEGYKLVGWRLPTTPEGQYDYQHGKGIYAFTIQKDTSVIAVWEPIVEGNDPATGDNPTTDDDLASADLGFMGVILNLISSIISFLANKVLPLVKPMLETTVKTVGPLVTDILTGIMN